MSQSATRRSLDILELLAGRPEGLGLIEICADLDIPKSIGHRLLALLSESGFVQQDETTAHYGLTLKLPTLGLRYLNGAGLTDVSQPILDRLAAASGELARLAVVEGEGMLWVALAQGASHGLRYDPDAGQNVILHATAVGKIWLSTLPEEDALRIVAATGFATPARFGPNAIRAIPELRKALRETRAQGFGVAIEEGEPGTAAVAVLVRESSDADARPVGTLSIAGPMLRMTEKKRRASVELLNAAAAEMSAIWPIRARAAATDKKRPKGDQPHVHNVRAPLRRPAAARQGAVGAVAR